MALSASMWCLKRMTMKYRLLILICACSIFAADLSAQEAPQSREAAGYKHEWRFGVAGYPFAETMTLSTWGYKVEPVAENFSDVDGFYSDYHGTRRMVGLFSAEYSYNFRKHWTFSIGGYLSAAGEKTYDYKNEFAGHNLGASLSIVPTIRGKYLVRDRFSMYASFGFGLNVTYMEEWSVFPTFIIVPLGLTFGDKVYGFVETGVGMLYIGGAAGIGYRF